MCRVNRAFKDLRPVAGNDGFGNRHLCVRRGRPGRRLELGTGFRWTHVGPHKTTPLLRRISQVLDLLCHAAGCRLRHHLHYIAVHVHLPAVVKATQAAVLIAAKHQRHTPVRAVFVHHAHAAIGVAKHNQVFAEHLRLDGRAVRLADFFNQAYRRPVAAHQLAHGRLAFHAAQQFIFFVGQHVQYPSNALIWNLLQNCLQIQINEIILRALRLFAVFQFVKKIYGDHDER
ncbi:hypothetical protein D9M73_52450 [compost metagenome]